MRRCRSLLWYVTGRSNACSRARRRLFKYGVSWRIYFLLHSGERAIGIVNGSWPECSIGLYTSWAWRTGASSSCGIIHILYYIYLKKRERQKVYYKWCQASDTQTVQNKTYFGIFMGVGKKEHRCKHPTEIPIDWCHLQRTAQTAVRNDYTTVNFTSSSDLNIQLFSTKNHHHKQNTGLLWNTPRPSYFHHETAT